MYHYPVQIINVEEFYNEVYDCPKYGNVYNSAHPKTGDIFQLKKLKYHEPVFGGIGKYRAAPCDFLRLVEEPGAVPYHC